MNERVSLFGLPFVAADRQSVVEEILERVSTKQQTFVLTANVDYVVRFLRGAPNDGFQAACRSADIIVADGMPIVWASRLLGKPLPNRVAGVDLLVDLCGAAAKKSLSVSFLGALPGVGEEAVSFLKARFPQLRIAGVYAPPIGFENVSSEIARAVDAANAGAPDFLFFALGSPKGEKWFHLVRPHLRAYGVMGVGASLDMLAGRVPRAPIWMQRAGLEWTWRLWQEPARLWRRYLTDAIMFPIYVWTEWWRRRSRDNA